MPATPYSPKCLEEKFCELRPNVVLGNSSGNFVRWSTYCSSAHTSSLGRSRVMALCNAAGLITLLLLEGGNRTYVHKSALLEAAGATYVGCPGGMRSGGGACQPSAGCTLHRDQHQRFRGRLFASGDTRRKRRCRRGHDQLQPSLACHHHAGFTVARHNR